MDELWQIERRLWLDGADFFADHMADDALMVFPDPVGILEGEAIVEGLRHAPRWSSVDMEEQTTVERDGGVILAYRATGQRNGQEPYKAFCMSVYEPKAGGWRITAHQQTPV